MSNPLPVSQGQRSEAGQRNKRGSNETSTHRSPIRDGRHQAQQKVEPGERDRHSASLAEVSPFAAGAGRRGGQKPLAALRSSGPTVGTHQRLAVREPGLGLNGLVESGKLRQPRRRNATRRQLSSERRAAMAAAQRPMNAFGASRRPSCQMLAPASSNQSSASWDARSGETRQRARNARACCTSRPANKATSLRTRLPRRRRPAASADASVRDSLRERNLR